MADHAAVRALAGQEAQRVDQQRLAGAGFAGNDGQAGAEFEFGRRDGGEITDGEVGKHACGLCSEGGAMTKGRQHAGPLDSRSWLQAVRRPPAGPRLAATACTRVAADIYEGHGPQRSEEHTSVLQPLMHISYTVFCMKT